MGIRNRILLFMESRLIDLRVAACESWSRTWEPVRWRAAAEAAGERTLAYDTSGERRGENGEDMMHEMRGKRCRKRQRAFQTTQSTAEKGKHAVHDDDWKHSQKHNSGEGSRKGTNIYKARCFPFLPVHAFRSRRCLVPHAAPLHLLTS